LSHTLRYKEKQNKARKVSLTRAMCGDHGYQFQYHLSNEESVRKFYRQDGYNCEVVDEEVCNKLAWIRSSMFALFLALYSEGHSTA
jgi:hypothetical protein